MKYLHDYRFSTVNLDDFIKWRKSSQLINSSSIVISFDDGLVETYTTVFPILLTYELLATIFIVTGFIGKNN